MNGPKITRTELNTVHCYQHYSLFMHSKHQYVVYLMWGLLRVCGACPNFPS